MTVSAFPYIGGKSQMAPWIIDHLPDHECYVEPFAGSAAVLLTKPLSTVEVLNDRDRDIVHFFEVVLEQPAELAEFVRNIPYSRQLYEEWAEDYYAGCRDDDPVARAGKWLYLRYASFGGKYGRRTGWKRASVRNRQPPSRNWENVDERIFIIRDRFRGAEIECLDYKDVIDRYDSEQTVFYCDPPYVEADDDYYRVSDSEFPHGELADTLTKIDGAAIVSYTDAPEDSPLRDWHVSEFKKKNAARRGSHTEWNDETTERLFMNFDPAETPTFVGAAQATLDCATDGGNNCWVEPDTDRSEGGESP